MKLNKIIDLHHEAQIAHRDWRIGHFISFKFGEWRKTIGPKGKVESFDIEKVDPEDDGFFPLSDGKMTYGMVGAILGGHNPNIIIEVDGGLIQNIHSSSMTAEVTVYDYDLMRHAGITKEEIDSRKKGFIERYYTPIDFTINS